MPFILIQIQFLFVIVNLIFIDLKTSPASERLDHCIFYLDEIHTRGTDFRFPKGFPSGSNIRKWINKRSFCSGMYENEKIRK